MSRFKPDARMAMAGLLVLAWGVFAVGRAGYDLLGWSMALRDVATIATVLLLVASGALALFLLPLPSVGRRQLSFAALCFAFWVLLFGLSRSGLLPVLPAAHPGMQLYVFAGNLLLVTAIILGWGGFIFGLASTERARVELQADKERLHRQAQEMRRIQGELRMFADALAQSHEAIFILDLQGRITYMNQAASRMLGYHYTEVVGRTAEEFDRNTGRPAHPKRILEEVLAHGQWSGELELLKKNNEPFVADTSCSLVRDETGTPFCMLALLRDVTQDKRMEAALRASEELHRLLANHVTDLIASFDMQGVFMYASPACRTLLGYEPEELVGRSAMDFLDRDDALRYMEMAQQGVDLNQLQRIQVKALRKDGHPVWLEITLKPLFSEEDGAPREVIAVCRDIGERLRAEEERRQLDKKIQEAQRQESLSVLAGGIAHDYNNLLLSITANIELAMLELPHDSEGRHSLIKALLAAESAADLTRQLLVYTGQAHLTRERINLSRLVGDMMHLIETAVSKKVQLQPDLARDLPEFEGDPTQWRQIVLNLITNASEAMEQKGGTVLVRTAVIHCTRAYLASAVLHQELAEGDYVCLEVRDTGIGMDQDTLKRIFDPFFTTKFPGRGLGLAALLGIVRAHHGAVDVQSAPGEGTRFRVLVPVSVHAAASPARAAAPAAN